MVVSPRNLSERRGVKWLLPVATITWLGLWWTPDQLGQRYFNHGEFEQAAQAFYDPAWQGAAYYKAGDFEAAAQAFARVHTAEGYYNQGNAWLMQGKYERAIKLYEQALAERPDWPEAEDNLAFAQARAKMLESKGGDMGDQKLGADKIVFDKDQQDSGKGQDTQVDGGEQMSAAAFQAMWLRQVTSKPADFLRAKFAYQLQTGEGGDE